jgi:hypothetical protein
MLWRAILYCWSFRYKSRYMNFGGPSGIFKLLRELWTTFFNVH